ncbi:putative uncharacterized protein ENSP00000383309 [Globicephala melas]|uniref:putative uncharacterized protein ENSP00000383309 n=1 Tax=Globicephala melas TaxID=9731 RepID=UPI003872D1C6
MNKCRARDATRPRTEGDRETPKAAVQVRPHRATRVRLDVRVSESERPPSADGALGRSDLPAEPTHAAQTLAHGALLRLSEQTHTANARESGLGAEGDGVSANAERSRCERASARAPQHPRLAVRASTSATLQRASPLDHEPHRSSRNLPSALDDIWSLATPAAVDRGPAPSAGKREKQPRAAGSPWGPSCGASAGCPCRSPPPAPLVPALPSSDSRGPGRSAGAAAPPAGHLAQARPREGRQGVGLSAPTSRLPFKVKSLPPARRPPPPRPAALKPDVEAAAALLTGARFPAPPPPIAGHAVEKLGVRLTVMTKAAVETKLLRRGKGTCPGSRGATSGAQTAAAPPGFPPGWCGCHGGFAALPPREAPGRPETSAAFPRRARSRRGVRGRELRDPCAPAPAARSCGSWRLGGGS